MHVKDILTKKGATVVWIRPDDTIADLCKMLKERRIGATIVSSDGKRIEGVISERDITYGMATHGAALLAMPVSALMTKQVITCTPRDKVAFVASTMGSRGIRHIPVEDNGRAMGMVSIRDVLNFRVDDLQQEKAHLWSFVKDAERPLQDRD